MYCFLCVSPTGQYHAGIKVRRRILCFYTGSGGGDGGGGAGVVMVMVMIMVMIIAKRREFGRETFVNLDSVTNPLPIPEQISHC